MSGWNWGLQSVNDETLLRVNRGHDSASFFRAFELLRSRGIKIAVHLIFGLARRRRSGDYWKACAGWLP